VEQYEIRYLVSGRDLITRPIAASLKPTTPIVFADPNYDLNQNETKLADDPKGRGGGAAKDDAKRDNAKTRDVEAAKSASALPKVSRLPGTAIEATAIKSSLASYAHGQPIVYTDTRALESTFKSVRRPRVVVLATHGFFLPDQKVSQDTLDNGGESAANERSVPALLDADGQPIENPLLRCGLLLAGCNSRTKGQTGSDDGILTGMEIIGTDLRGTELVVLSACETGLGQIHNGEGVAGLRQAFQLAGAQSVVATLWQIPDSDSSAIMSTFFEKLAGGDSKVESLRQAQLARIATLRQRYAAAPPVFWAAFTVTGR
jgi:CHAT domain-containing protein